MNPQIYAEIAVVVVFFFILPLLLCRWERLSSEKSKLPWLKIDFDRWQNEDDDDDEERKEEEERERLRQEMMNGGFGDSTYGERVEGYSDKVGEETWMKGMVWCLV